MELQTGIWKSKLQRRFQNFIKNDPTLGITPSNLLVSKNLHQQFWNSPYDLRIELPVGNDYKKGIADDYCHILDISTATKKGWYTVSCSFFCLYTAQIPKFLIQQFVYCQFWFQIILTTFVYQSYTNLHLLFHMLQTIFCSQILTTYHLIWLIPTVYHSLKNFNIFLLMQLVILINTDLYIKCIPQICHPRGHYLSNLYIWIYKYVHFSYIDLFKFKYKCTIHKIF